MSRPSLFAIAVGLAALVYFAGRAWNPAVADWTHDPPPAWRGADGPGFTLTCPSQFEERRPQGDEWDHGGLILQPPGHQFAALHVYADRSSARHLPWKSPLAETRRQFGLPPGNREGAVRIGWLLGRGQSGRHPSGRFWKVAALDVPAGESAAGRLIVAYEQVSAEDRALFDQVLGTVRPRR